MYKGLLIFNETNNTVEVNEIIGLLKENIEGMNEYILQLRDLTKENVMRAIIKGDVFSKEDIIEKYISKFFYILYIYYNSGLDTKPSKFKLNKIKSLIFKEPLSYDKYQICRDIQSKSIFKGDYISKYKNKIEYKGLGKSIDYLSEKTDEYRIFNDLKLYIENLYGMEDTLECKIEGSERFYLNYTESCVKTTDKSNNPRIEEIDKIIENSLSAESVVDENILSDKILDTILDRKLNYYAKDLNILEKKFIKILVY